MSDISYFTDEGLAALKKELLQLKTVERPSISRQIAEARDKGDLSENAEYDAAKEAQGLLEMKISGLEAKLSNARIIDIPGADVYVIQRAFEKYGAADPFRPAQYIPYPERVPFSDTYFAFGKGINAQFPNSNLLRIY